MGPCRDLLLIFTVCCVWGQKVKTWHHPNDARAPNNCGDDSLFGIFRIGVGFLNHSELVLGDYEPNRARYRDSDTGRNDCALVQLWHGVLFGAYSSRKNFLSTMRVRLIIVALDVRFLAQ